MSALVHPENQKIIWNIVNNNIYVNEFFQTHSNVSKEQWFRSIIEKFYMQNEGRNLSVHELNLLNKDVLTFMVKSIHSIPMQPEAPQHPPPSNTFDQRPPSNTFDQRSLANTFDQRPPSNYPSQIQTPPYVPNTIGEETNKQFEEKKHEYEQMNAKPIPEEVDFKEKDKDTIIENMDELINVHIQEREKQLKELAPPLLTNVEPAVAMPLSTNVEPAVAMPNNQISNNITGNVQDGLPTSKNNKEIQTNEETGYDELRNEIATLKEEMKRLQEEHIQMKQELSSKIESNSVNIRNIQGEIVIVRDNANKINNFDQQSEKSDE